ncbi:MAG TPA: asparagine synthase-related protein, partial [Galbitalea sp.]|nr:asparagine synthase-related protein [Galbitalea sp.]
EWAFSLPLTYLVRDGWLKWILRQAVAELLPAEVVWRRHKLGFPFPIEAWLVENKATFFAAVGGSSVACPFVDLRRLAARYDVLARTHPMMLWRAMSVCLWWKRVVLGEELEQPARASAMSV